MATPNPMDGASAQHPPVSCKTFHIAGIITNVYGLDEIPKGCDSVACLWLLHPRLQKAETMAPIASHMINAWNKRPQKTNSTKGLIAVSFDQRNHGSRQVVPLANEAWKQGNPTHAQDMFGVFQGTSFDTSLLMDHLGSYIFLEPGAPSIKQHLAMGISLGGHSTWHQFFHEPRVSAAVVIIGCPDYQRVMTDRARLTKLDTYTEGNGKNFHGSKHFPTALVAAIRRWDPTGLLFQGKEIEASPSSEEQERIRKILDARVKSKSILVCSGGADKLVPYHCAEPFMKFFKNATSGWYRDGNVYVEDNVYDGVGHAYSDGMAKDAERFIVDVLEGKNMSSAGKPRM